jgi:3-methyladenine DNA glycosylase AlkD
MLLRDDHDLIRKACGWILREARERNPVVLEGFLRQHQGVIPRTKLSYAIERFSPDKCGEHLSGPKK